jgi:hypothetical protein
MNAYLELAKLVSQGWLSRAYSARPDAPVQPYAPRRRLIRRVALRPRARWVGQPRRAPTRIECAPSA